MLKWAWGQGERILFLPDQHLGRNTAYKMGVPLDQMAVWDPNEFDGGLATDEALAAKLLLWKGHCSVHERFTVQQIALIREQHPGVRVIVHPEVPWDVVQAADDSGSTEYILKQVRESAPGSVWAVGTEVHLVNRLAHEVAPEKTVISLDQSVACARRCSACRRTTCSGFWKSWSRGACTTDRGARRQQHWVRVALDRMLEVV